MKNIVELKHISVKNKEKEVLNDLSWEIKEGTFITLLGRSGSGKTTLIKSLLGLTSFDGEIIIDGISLTSKSIKEIRSKVGVVFENPNTNLICETVFDELKTTLKNFGFPKEEIKERIDEITKTLKLDHILSKNTTHLSGGEKQLASLAVALITEPKILVLDEAFTMLDGVTKESLLKQIKKYQKEKKITVIQVTHDIEDIFYGTHMAILDEGKICASDKLEKLLSDEKLFKETHLSMPFMAELSLKLKYYDLVEKPIYDLDKMVKYLWK